MITKNTISLVCGAFLVVAQAANAGNATWSLNPASTNWNTATNWTPATVPDGAANVATFVFSNQPNVSLALIYQLQGIVFEAGASPFTINVTPKATSTTLTGVGITNNSGIVQNFVTNIDPFRTQGLLVFANSATAGSMTQFTNRGGLVDGHGGAATLFTGSSSADHGTFVNNGGAVSGAVGGFVGFSGSATAGNGALTGEGGVVSGAVGGPISFSDSATAGDSLITLNGGAVSGAAGAFSRFSDTATAGNATIVVNGGIDGGTGAFVAMEGDSVGGTSRVEVFGNGYLDISFHNDPGVTFGSVEGDGAIFLGGLDLALGGNGLSTTVSGLIQDGGQNPVTGGSVTKVGAGTLTLSGTNTYTGGTFVEEGVLVLANPTGSATGSGPVQIDAGTITGTSRVTGTVVVGTGSGPGAVLAPGRNGPGTLNLNSTLTFNADATYNCEFRFNNGKMDKVTARGVTINGATFSLIGMGAGTLTQGTVFIVIQNSSATPIAGVFNNLADGSVLTVGSNNFQANYKGGDGNDLALTVVP